MQPIVDESSCEWLPPTSEVKRTGEQQSIAGYQAEQVVATGTQACRDPKTSQVCQFTLTLDQWIAPDFKEADETLRFQKAYAERLGLTAGASRDVAERAEAMFGRYEGIWKDIAVKMQEVEGYPVKTSVALGVGGPECQAASDAASMRETRPLVGGGAVPERMLCRLILTSCAPGSDCALDLHPSLSGVSAQAHVM